MCQRIVLKVSISVSRAAALRSEDPLDRLGEAAERIGQVAAHPEDPDSAGAPQLSFIHIHQLFRIQYTCFN